MTPFLVNPQRKRKSNPSHLVLINRKKKGKRPVAKKTKTTKKRNSQGRFLKGQGQAPARRRVSARQRSSPVRRRASVGRRRYRRNPLVRGKALEQMLLVGAGFLVAPMVTNLIPFTPTTAFGGYIKKAAAVTVGGTVVTQMLGKRYGSALMLGGMISVGVDLLRDFVPAFGGAGSGVGAYLAPNADIEGMSGGSGMAATGLLPESPGVPQRWASRYSLPAVAGIC